MSNQVTSCSLLGGLGKGSSDDKGESSVEVVSPRLIDFLHAFLEQSLVDILALALALVGILAPALVSFFRTS